MKDVAKISISSLIGAVVVYFLIKKLPKGVEKPAEEEPQYYYLQLPPIYLPTNIPEEKINEVVDKLGNPKVLPSMSGWQIQWDPIPVDLTTGQVNVAPAPKQLPLINEQELRNNLNAFKPQLEKQDTAWKISFPTIQIEL